jgi:hypothetical protein
MKAGDKIRVPLALLQAQLPSYVDVKVEEVDEKANVAHVSFEIKGANRKIRIRDLSQTAGASRALERTEDESVELPPSPEGGDA